MGSAVDRLDPAQAEGERPAPPMNAPSAATDHPNGLAGVPSAVAGVQ